ncbi:MAG: hypothetical protein ABUL69_05975, partial [Peristeroidobacter soli]
MASNTARTPAALLFLLVLAGALPCAAIARESAPAYVPQVINPDLNGGLVVGGSRVLLLWGSDGVILRSEDGVRWTHAVTPGTQDLARAAANVQGDVLITVGASGTILRSTDAGRTWQSARNKTVDQDLRKTVTQPGTRTWVSVGTNGRVVRSL